MDLQCPGCSWTHNCVWEVGLEENSGIQEEMAPSASGLQCLPASLLQCPADPLPDMCYPSSSDVLGLLATGSKEGEVAALFLMFWQCFWIQRFLSPVGSHL